MEAVEKAVRKEFEQQGYNGRFGPGLPRISDGSLLFMLHLVKKMRPVKDGGARFIIVQTGSPLFTGGAGSGESEIRRYLLENDLVEAIVALPTEMFYNTGIATYLWIVTNHKLPQRKGKLQLIDAQLLRQDAQEPWIDHEKTKVGYEIPFNRHFYVFQPPRGRPKSTPT